ncbi:MAG: tRNA guanosine(34) transglycosylase Tgt [bacterium]|nr:tRNA guanosine(34) transglycosylase Tgt [bacterium]
MVSFKIITTDKKARTGLLKTAHGDVETPAFLPVATQAAVKALSNDDLKATNCSMILSNTYHLYLRPGDEIIKNLGGLHKFMGWDGPILTDSGGFQVFSLGFGIEHEVGKIVNLYGEKLVMGEINKETALIPRVKLCKVEEDGPTFQSHIDGSVHFFPPEKSVEVQIKLGADLIVALDECTSPLHNYDYTKTSMERSHRWEKRSLGFLQGRTLQALQGSTLPEMFGVIQGGPFEDLRIESAKFVSDNDFFGVGIGGALVSKEKMQEILDWTHPYLAPEKPRHLLGIGTVDDIFEAVERGVDIFDCVEPTRIARHGRLLIRKGNIDITKTEYKASPLPLTPNCSCYSCQNFSQAYVHHLFRSHELLAYRLATIHNVYFMMQLMKEIRLAISEKRLDKLKRIYV